MKMKAFKIILIVGAVFLLYYCSSSFYVPSSAQISSAQSKWPQADSAYIFEGYALYKSKCGSCHYLYKPFNYSSEQWNHILPNMKEKAKLTEVDYTKIKIYLLALCERESSDND